MKLLRVIPVFVCLLGLQFLTNGCKEDASTQQNLATDSTQSKIVSDQAYQMVEGEMDKLMGGGYSTPSDFDQLKFSSALAMYNNAVALNPRNMEAHFGAAITEMLAAYSDPAINNLIKGIDSTGSAGMKRSQPVQDLISTTLIPNTTGKMNVSSMPAAAGIVFTLQTAMNNPPLISKVQQVLRDNFLPKVQSAIDHLTVIESDEAFKFVISGKMQGDSRLKSVTLYPTEIALLNAMMHFIKFNIQTMLIYKFDLPDYSQASLVNALSQDNTSFFVLQSDGRTRADDAKQTYLACIGKLRKAIDYLERISGSQPDAIIKLGPKGISQPDLDRLKSNLTKMESAVSSPIEFKATDIDGNEYTVSLNLGAFFANPPANPKKDWLPAYTVTPQGTNDIRMQFNAATYGDFNFPDPTFGGLFVSMTQEDLKRLLRIDETYAYVFNGYVSIQPYPYGATSLYPSAGITVALTVNNRVYSTYTNEGGSFKLLIRDAGAVAQPVTKYCVKKDGIEYEVQNISGASLPGVKAKTSTYAAMQVTFEPANLTASKMSSPTRVNLAWKVAGSASGNYYNFDAYKIERKTESGTFVTITPSVDMYSLSATDQSVVAGTQYTYRIRTKLPSEYQYNGYPAYMFVPKSVMYSNEVTVTP